MTSNETNFEAGLTVLGNCERKSKKTLIKLFTDEHKGFQMISIKSLKRCVILCGPPTIGLLKFKLFGLDREIYSLFCSLVAL